MEKKFVGLNQGIPVPAKIAVKRELVRNETSSEKGLPGKASTCGAGTCYMIATLLSYATATIRP